MKYNRMRARVLFPLQPRTTFREYGQDMVALMSEPKESLLAKYEQAIARRRR